MIGASRASRHRRRGSVTLYALMIWLPVVALVLLFGVERGQLMLARSELSSAADAASLAGASGLGISPAEARARAKAVALSNTVNGRPLQLLDSDIEIGTWDDATKTFTVLTGANETLGNALRVNANLAAARGTGVEMAFQGMFSGTNTADLQRSAIGQATVAKANDLVLVQDVTGSFTEEISYARDGDLMLLDSLNSTGSSTRFGLVAFTGTANTISPLVNVAWNYSALRTAVSTLAVDGVGMPSSSTSTDIAAGLENAIAVFDAATVSKNARTIIVVSDGECRANSNGAHPTLNDDELLALAGQLADTAWSKNISVFVIFYDSEDSQSSADKLASLVRGSGTFLRVTNVNELADTIGNQVIKGTRLVR